MVYKKKRNRNRFSMVRHNAKVTQMKKKNKRSTERIYAATEKMSLKENCTVSAGSLHHVKQRMRYVLYNLCNVRKSFGVMDTSYGYLRFIVLC